MREAVVENEFVKAVRKAGGVAYKLTSQTTNGLPDRLVLFFPAKTVVRRAEGRRGRCFAPCRGNAGTSFRNWVSLSCASTGSPRSNLQSGRSWTGYPVKPFPEGIGAKVPELDVSTLPVIPGSPEA